MGQQWPFHLARGPAESLIKPRAVKTEQTAKPMPETDTHSLSFSLNRFFSLFFFHHSFSFFGLGSDRKNVIHGLRWHSWAKVWGEKGGGGGVGGGG